MNIAEFLSNFDYGQKIGAGFAIVIGSTLSFIKIKSIWKKGSLEDAKIGTDQSKATTEKSLIDTLHQEFLRINEELSKARKFQFDMNTLIHEQALKLNRMEMLMMRMYNLLNHNNVLIPDDLKDHMHSMLNGPREDNV